MRTLQTNGQTTRKQIREAFKTAGYSVSFQRHPFNDGLCYIAFKNAEMIKPRRVADGEIYSQETYDKHKQAFQTANIFRGLYLTDTEQKIL